MVIYMHINLYRGKNNASGKSCQESIWLRISLFVVVFYFREIGIGNFRDDVVLDDPVTKMISDVLDVILVTVGCCPGVFALDGLSRLSLLLLFVVVQFEVNDVIGGTGSYQGNKTQGND